jgi:hypothetical protein
LESVSVQQTGPNPPQPTTLEEKTNRTPPIIDIVEEALRIAGIRVSSGYSFNNDPLNTLTVFVGLRPRDKMGVLPPKFGQKDLPNDVTDDDF